MPSTRCPRGPAGARCAWRVRRRGGGDGGGGGVGGRPPGGGEGGTPRGHPAHGRRALAEVGVKGARVVGVMGECIAQSAEDKGISGEKGQGLSKERD